MFVSRFHCNLALVSCAVLVLTGCGTSSFAPGAAEPGTAISGRVHGGQQAVGGASISLYAAGTTGNGLGAVSLLRTPVFTAGDGSFGITNDYTCPSGATQVYLVARGGNPGLAAGTNNAGLVMMTALGDCGNLSGASFVSVNEVTTVAAAWALSQFMAVGAGVGSSATNATGLRNAFLVASNLVNTSNGVAPGAALPAGATIELTKLYTLADALAPCVNSDGSVACSPLYSAATYGASVPSNTLDAALNVVWHPSANVAAVFNTTTPNGPFQPILTKAPNDWTMTATYTGGGLALPTALGVDSTGSVWAANYFGGSATKLSATGVPALAGGFGDSALYESYGLAIDAQDNVWITNEENDPYNNNNGSVTKFSSSGTSLSGSGFIAGNVYYPYAIAADSNNTMWVADFGRSGASLLASDGSSLAGSAGYASPTLPLPVGVAVDSLHNAWFAASGSAVKVTAGGAITQYACCRSPSAIAVDPAGNVWVTDYSASALVELSAGGAVLQRLSGVGGISYPESLAIDGAGSVWVASYHGNSISGFSTASGGAASTVLSPTTGLGLNAGLSEPFGIVADASGNLWISNFAGNSLTQFIGLAAPVKTPMAGPPVAP